MPETWLGFLVGAAGAGITIASTMIAGWRLQALLLRYAPQFAPNHGALLGLAIGLAIVAGWLVT